GKGQSTPTGASLDALSDNNSELPRLLLVVVSVVGSLLLALNIVLVICFIKRRKNRHSKLKFFLYSFKLSSILKI
ncbi:nephrin, partial [Trichonephila inaurata madagascariensis]